MPSVAIPPSKDQTKSKKSGMMGKLKSKFRRRSKSSASRPSTTREEDDISMMGKETVCEDNGVYQEDLISYHKEGGQNEEQDNGDEGVVNQDEDDFEDGNEEEYSTPTNKKHHAEGYKNEIDLSIVAKAKPIIALSSSGYNELSVESNQSVGVKELTSFDLERERTASFDSSDDCRAQQDAVVTTTMEQQDEYEEFPQTHDDEDEVDLQYAEEKNMQCANASLSSEEKQFENEQYEEEQYEMDQCEEDLYEKEMDDENKHCLSVENNGVEYTEEKNISREGKETEETHTNVLKETNDAKKSFRLTSPSQRANIESPILCSVPENGSISIQDDDEGNESNIAEESDLYDAGAAITTTFGERTARLLGADPWGDRQDGFDAIQAIIVKMDFHKLDNKPLALCASLAAVNCGVEDRVVPVMYCALNCLKTILKVFAPEIDSSFELCTYLLQELSKLSYTLVSKLNDSNKRTRREASKSIIRLVNIPQLKMLKVLIPQIYATSIPLKARLEVLGQLIKELGFGAENSLTPGMVMDAAAPALSIADDKTRKLAIEIVVVVSLHDQEAAAPYLRGIKPAMLKILERKITQQKEKDTEKLDAQSKNQEEEEETIEKSVELLPVLPHESKKLKKKIESGMNEAENLFGPVLWRKLRGETWNDRLEGVQEIEASIQESKSDLRDVKPCRDNDIQLHFFAHGTLLHHFLVDRIAPVVNCALECFNTLIKIYGDHIDWKDPNITEIMLQCLMRLFKNLRKANNRINRGAVRCILRVARIENVHCLLLVLSCLFSEEVDALSQMHILRLLIPEFGFTSNGISSSMTLEAIKNALKENNDKVRKTAMDVALNTQRLVGKKKVLQHLQEVKPIVLKELEKNFVENEQSSERPQTVHSSEPATLPPLTFEGGEGSRRKLSSAPNGVGQLCCTSPMEMGSSFFSGSEINVDEEDLMASILGGGGDF